MTDPYRWDYRGETLEEIFSKVDFDDVDKLNLIESGLGGFKRPSELSKDEVTFLAIMALEREVNNGGYHQFFSNSSGQYVPVIVDSLKRIGCPKVAKLTQKAIDLLGPIDLNDPDAVQNACCGDDGDENQVLEACAPYDEKFYAYPEDISGKLMLFIRANADKIHLPGPDSRYSEVEGGYGRRAGDPHPAPPKYETSVAPPFWKRLFGGK